MSKSPSQGNVSQNGSLFVYGTLLDAAHRAALLGREVAGTPARLRSYERRRSRYYYVAARSGVDTEGLVLGGLGRRDFDVLDRYEDVPRLYVRAPIEVELLEAEPLDGARLRCWIYLPTTELLRSAR